MGEKKVLSAYLNRHSLKYDAREVLRWPMKILINHLIFPRRSYWAAALRGTIINRVGGRKGVSYIFKDVLTTSYKDLILGKDSIIEEGTILDLTDGPLTLGDLAIVGPGVLIEGPVTLGYGSSIRQGCIALKHTTLEDWVGISSNVHFITFSHDIGDENYRVGKIRFDPILVKRGTWIGTRATIMPGVTIGKACVIGAGSLVTKDIPDYSLAVGSPAKVVRKIGPEYGGGLPPEMQKVWKYEKW